MLGRISFASFLILSSICAVVAQEDLKIKKKIKISIPGMEAQLAGVQQVTKDGNLNDAFNQTADVYIKGSRVRTDSTYKKPTITGIKLKKISLITQCDKQRTVTFSEEKKKYYVEDATVDAKSKKGGYVNISVKITDTGERMKLFGYDSKHIKQIISITPGKNSCLKKSMTLSVDGWYADIPTYSCPLRPDVTQMQESNGCYDEVVFDLKGEIATGFPVKEIKSLSVDGQNINFEEEVVALERTTLSAAMFEPPPNYAPGNSKAEVQSDGEGVTASQAASAPPAAGIPSGVPAMAGATPPLPPSLAPPGAGVAPAAAVPIGPKPPGAIRVGVAKPAVTTPETKKDPNAGWDIAQAVSKSVAENLRTNGIDAFELTSENAASECAEKSCDYIFYATVTQKRGGGGMFGKMIAMTAVSMAGAMIPGVGSMIAATIASQVMNQTMGKAAKAKDEFTFEHKVARMDQSVVAQASSKKKTEKDGEDVLSPQIKAATDAALAAIKK